MDKLLDRPWFLRVTALFLAIILFFSVQADEGNLKNKTAGDQVDYIHEVPVEVYYDDENLVVTGVPETVKITIEGPISVVQTTKLLKDFTVFVDLRTLTMGQHHVRIKHENISEKLKVRIDPSLIDVIIEEKITKTFPVEPEMNTRLLAEDYNVVNMVVEPSTIEVTGAKSVIEAISFVKATVASGEGINKSFEHEADVRILDRDLNKLNVEIAPEKVIVKVDVVENNKEVPIVLKAKGTPAEGVVIDSLVSEQAMMKIFGSRKVLDELEEFIVEVDISKVTESGKVEVDVKKPKGTSEISNTKINVTIKATVKDLEDEEIEEAAGPDTETNIDNEEELEEVVVMETKIFEDIKVVVNGLNRKYKSDFVKPENGLLTLTITAKSTIMKNLKSSNFSVFIDASNTDTEGEQVYPVMVKGPENVSWIVSEAEVTMNIELT